MCVKIRRWTWLCFSTEYRVSLEMIRIKYPARRVNACLPLRLYVNSGCGCIARLGAFRTDMRRPPTGRVVNHWLQRISHMGAPNIVPFAIGLLCRLWIYMKYRNMINYKLSGSPFCLSAPDLGFSRYTSTFPYTESTGVSLSISFQHHNFVGPFP